MTQAAIDLYARRHTEFKYCLTCCACCHASRSPQPSSSRCRGCGSRASWPGCWYGSCLGCRSTREAVRPRRPCPCWPRAHQWPCTQQLCITRTQARSWQPLSATLLLQQGRRRQGLVWDVSCWFASRQLVHRCHSTASAAQAAMLPDGDLNTLMHHSTLLALNSAFLRLRPRQRRCCEPCTLALCRGSQAR